MNAKYVTNFRGDSGCTPNNKLYIKDEPETPIEDDFGEHNLHQIYDNDYGSMRKSLSMSDIAALREDLVEFENSECENVYQRYRRPTLGPQQLSKTKFVSMAEAIYHYQRDTPGRFHSVKPAIFRGQCGKGPSGLTVPLSPKLRSKARSRPVHILSQKEKEEMEIEEIKKFKIKAQPVPKSVIEGPIHLPEVPKKPVTKPEPFHLTEVQKKPVDLTETHKFKARPVPKQIFEKPQVPVKQRAHTTKPVSPNLTKVQPKRATSAEPFENKKSESQKATEKNQQRSGPVKPEPFSFEKRNEELKRRKEEKIKRQIEEERKQASQFKAHPLPDAVKKQMQQVTTKGCSSTTSSENKENHVKFEAKPPTVLLKEPFKPVHQPHIIMPKPFDLTTEKRAAEREKFERQLKQKEEEMERIRLLKEKEQFDAEEKAKAALRAKLVHHPKPRPTVTPFVPEKSVVPITVPQTPTFVRRLKNN